MSNALKLPLLILALLASPSALAVDGVREINQSCVSLGCFPGDARGFPVEIDALRSGSYRLTSNLVLPETGQGAILIDAPFTTIDLNGFNILGPNDCNGSVGNVRCSIFDTTVGIQSRATGTTVRNGGVHGLGGTAVELLDHASVVSVRVTDAGADGIVVGSDSRVHESRVWEVAGDGIRDAPAAVRVLASANHVSQTGGEPIEADVVQADGNLCDGAMCTTLPPAPAPSSAGPREINQTCALAGCFAGDAPGFPVEIGSFSGGSYRLTGNLILGVNDSSAITIAAHFTTIDFDGFSIRGPNDCTETAPGSVSCTNTGSGAAVFGQATGTTIRGGGIHGVVGSGISLGEYALVDDMRVSNLNGTAVTVGAGSVVRASQVWEVGLNGIVGPNSAEQILVSDNHVSAVGFRSMVSGITEVGGNLCDDGRCSAVPKKRFYLTESAFFDGMEAPAACDEGFHMASLYEISEPSSLRYDPIRGLSNTGDTFSQPPANRSGWVRTGTGFSGSSIVPGTANCDAWSSNDVSDSGTRVSLSASWESGTTLPTWVTGAAFCSGNSRVWCVQD